MKRISIFFFILVSLGLSLKMSAQNVNLTVEPNPGNNTLDVYLTSNGVDYTSEQWGSLVFTLKWDTIGDFSLGSISHPGFWGLLFPLNTAGGETDDGGVRYQKYVHVTPSNFNSGFNLELLSGIKTLYAQIDMSGYAAAGLDICSFKFENDSWTAANNGDFYMEIHANNRSGNINKRGGVKTSYSSGNWDVCDFENLESVDTALVDNGVYVANTDVSLKLLKVQPGAVLEVNTLNTLTVDSIAVLADATGYGQYIGNSVSGVFQQYVGTSAGWRHMGFPVNEDFSSLDLGGAPINYGGGATGNLYFFENNGFSWQSVDASSEVAGGKGVSVYLGGSNFPTSGIISWAGTSNDNASGITYNYSTDPNTDPTLDGWNFMANPYPCNVSWHSVDDQQSGVFSSYSVFDPGNGFYASYSELGGSSGAFSTNQYIAPGQAVWVKTSQSDDGKTLSFSNSDRSSSGGNVFKGRFKTNTNGKGSIDRIKLNLNGVGNNYHDGTVVFFNSGSTQNYESTFDSYKAINLSPNPNLYTKARSDEKLSINGFGGFDPSNVIPLYFSSDQYEDYEIDLEIGDIDPNWGNIFLVDLYAGNTHNLLNDGAYVFNHTQLAPENRFEIHFSNNIGSEEYKEDSSKLRIYSYENTVAISRNNPLGRLNVVIYTIAGRKVYEGEFGTEKLIEFKVDLPSAYYIVKALGTKGVFGSSTVIIY